MSDTPLHRYQANTDLPRRIAIARAGNATWTIPDLTQDAHAALWKAAHTYDTTLGVPFRAYASQRIRWSLLDAQRDNDTHSRRHRDLIKSGATHAITLTHITAASEHLVTVDDHADAVALAVDLDRAMDRLEWWQDYCIRQRYLHDLPVTLIAREVERSEAWVYLRIRTGLARLRDAPHLRY
jgi:RNA polymerase sigma factor (sigma-70 family)